MLLVVFVRMLLRKIVGNYLEGSRTWRCRVRGGSSSARGVARRTSSWRAVWLSKPLTAPFASGALLLGNEGQIAVRIIAACVLAFFACAPAFAECVTVKYRSTPHYRDTPVFLDTFDCSKTPQGGDVREVCFDAKNSYMLINLNETWYHYCSVDPASDDNFLKAQPI